MRHFGKYFSLRIFGVMPQSVCRQKQPFPPLLKGPKYDTVAIAIKAERQLRRLPGEPGGVDRRRKVAIAIKAERQLRQRQRYGHGSRSRTGHVAIAIKAERQLRLQADLKVMGGQIAVVAIAIKAERQLRHVGVGVHEAGTHEPLQSQSKPKGN